MTGIPQLALLAWLAILLAAGILLAATAADGRQEAARIVAWQPPGPTSTMWLPSPPAGRHHREERDRPTNPMRRL